MLKWHSASNGGSSTLTRQKKQQLAPTVYEEEASLSSNASASSIGGFVHSWTASLSPSPSSSHGGCRLRGRSSSVSSLSSAGSSNESSLEYGPLKIHTGKINKETDYKTVFISTAATASDVVSSLLSKFRMTSRDRNLFRLSMELKTKREGVDVTNVLVLEDDAKPLELQRCHPKEMSRFVLQMAAGTLVRVYDFSVSPESNYKSIMISRRTSCREAIRLLLLISRLPVAPDQFVLVGCDGGKEFLLPQDASLVALTEQASDSQQVHLRRFARERFALTSCQQLNDSDSLPAAYRFLRRNSTRRPPGLSEKKLEIDLRAMHFDDRDNV